MLTGENGVLTKANNAKEENKKATAEEKVGLEVQGSYDETGKINISDLNNNLKNVEGLTHNGGTITDNPIDSLPATVVVDGNNVIIRENGSVVLSEWTQTGYEITNGEITLKVGDYVLNYDEGTGSTQIETTESGHTEQQMLTTENLGWRILGIGENGGLELISDNPTSTTKVTLSGETGYLNGEEVLNTTCSELYGQGEYAESARSLNVEDINKLGNYNPETERTTYGELWKYRFSTEEGCMQYSKLAKNEQEWSEWANITNERHQTFKIPGQPETERISKDNPKESEIIKNTYCYYGISSIIGDTKIADMITKGTGDIDVKQQWLASHTVNCNNSNVTFYLHNLSSSGLWGAGLYASTLYSSYGYSSSISWAVRPVVTLESNIQLEGNSEDGWTIK